MVQFQLANHVTPKAKLVPDSNTQFVGEVFVNVRMGSLKRMEFVKLNWVNWLKKSGIAEVGQ